MIELVIGNSVCQLKNLPTQHYRALKQILCYRDTSKRIQKVIRDKVTKKPLINATTGKVRTMYINPTSPLIDKTGSFPTGLLSMVRAYAKKHSVRMNVVDTRKVPKAHSIGLNKSFKLPEGIPSHYPEQIEAAKAVVARHRGIISAPTGLGKSLIAALILKELGVPTLIVVPSLELKKQLTLDLIEMFDENTVGGLVKGKKYYNVTVENVDQLDPTKPINGFDCVIIDEFHHSGAATYRKLNQKSWTDIYYRIGMTATPFRSRDEEQVLLQSVLDETIYTISYETAVQKGYIVPLEFYYVDLPKIKVKGTTWQTVYKELVVNRKDRNDLLSTLMQNVHEGNCSALVLVKEINHGMILSSMFPQAQFVHSSNDKSAEIIEQFSKGDITVVIGSPVIGEGVNTRACEYVFMGDMTKSKNLFMQRCGRAVRLFKGKTSGKIILFRDSSHKWLLNHFNQCVKYIKEEYGTIPSKLIID